MDEERKIQMYKKIKMLLALKFKKDDALPAEIAPNVYIGSIGAALNKQYLQESHITHILTVADNINQSYPNDFVYKNIEITDRIDFNLLEVLEDAIKFIEEALTAEGKVLVHCFAGKSRSAAVCAGYIMKTYNLRLEQALKAIKEKRGCIMPNAGFLFQLELYEKLLSSVSK
jgi:protein-tyrosine phosphatase